MSDTTPIRGPGDRGTGTGAGAGAGAGAVGMIGLGVMGSAMGRNLHDAGFTVIGHDIDPERGAAFVGRSERSVEAVTATCDRIILSLPTSAALADVVGALVESGRAGTVVAETGTFSLDAKLSARARLAEADITLLDTPLSGTGLQAADGTLVVLSSGDPSAHDRMTPVFDVIGKQTFDLGGFGNGSRMKFVANLLVTVNTLAAAEAHVLGAAAGLDPEVVQEVIAPGAGGSTMFDVRGPMMVDGRFDPPAARLSVILKDATLIARHAADLGSPTPLLDAALPLYTAAAEAGLGDLDAAAIHRWLGGLDGV